LRGRKTLPEKRVRSSESPRGRCQKGPEEKKKNWGKNRQGRKRN